MCVVPLPQLNPQRPKNALEKAGKPDWGHFISYMTHTHMRHSFDALAEHVRVFLGQDPLGGNLFVIGNRSAERLKIHWWDNRDGPEAGGLVIFYNALTRHIPVSRDLVQRSEVARHYQADLMRLLEALRLPRSGRPFTAPALGRRIRGRKAIRSASRAVRTPRPYARSP